MGFGQFGTEIDHFRLTMENLGEVGKHMVINLYT